MGQDVVERRMLDLKTPGLQAARPHSKRRHGWTQRGGGQWVERHHLDDIVARRSWNPNQSLAPSDASPTHIAHLHHSLACAFSIGSAFVCRISLHSLPNNYV
jgi:hypothetical protein